MDLIDAASSGHKEKVLMLLEKGAETEAKDGVSHTRRLLTCSLLLLSLLLIL
jgi:hypothetical protein